MERGKGEHEDGRKVGFEEMEQKSFESSAKGDLDLRFAKTWRPFGDHFATSWRLSNLSVLFELSETHSQPALCELDCHL